ncbi:MAG: alkaline phosphatase family protein [Candidatus Omnitrophica bacterium]|nr:alkaline phosphatase family protein [Candidatus Omnitrophota bacterium]
MAGKEKVFVIGIDGATFDLLMPWIKEGKMPTLQRLINQGAWGHLESVFPPLTPVAWSSFMTGKNPGKHGIFNFMYRQQGSYNLKPISFSDVDGKTLWRIINDNGLKVGVMNVPLTYPPEEVEHFLISSFLSPMSADNQSYPQNLVDELKKELGKYLIHPIKVREGNNFSQMLLEKYEMIKNRTEAALYLMKKYECDFFMVHYLASDSMQHEFWHLADEDHPQFDSKLARKHKDILLNFFTKLDQYISQLVSNLKSDTTLVIMSDHGFGRITNFLHLNTWLLKEGFLALKKNPLTGLKYLLFKIGITPSLFYRLAMKVNLAWLSRNVDLSKKTSLLKKFFLSLEDVDWQNTRAYSLGYYGFGQVNINLKGREPLGCVEPGEEEKALLEKLQQRLKEIKDPFTGERIVESVKKRTELFQGKHLKSAPDLFLFPHNFETISLDVSGFSSHRVIERTFGHTGSHRPNGIILLRGEHIKENSQIKGAQITDLAPTILYLLGLPIPKDMDGKVLTSAIKETSLRQKEAKFYHEKDAPERKKMTFSGKEEEEIKQKLSDLGYL